MNTKASNWFSDPAEFRRLCGDAQSQAKSESAQEFTAEMMKAANQHGLNTYISGPQLQWLCKIADWIMPEEQDLVCSTKEQRERWKKQILHEPTRKRT